MARIHKAVKVRLAKPETVKLHLPSEPVKIEAADAEKKTPASFIGLAYSGGIVSRNTATPALEADYVIDLVGMTQGRSAKANLDHKPTQRVGHIKEYANDGKGLTLGGLLSAATPHREEVVNSAVDGFEWDLSIEADLMQPRRIAAGKTATVNGRTVTGPLLIFGKSILTGLAFVSRGADEGNSVTIAASDTGAENMDFKTWVASLGLDLDTVSAGQRANLQAAYDAQQGGGTGGGNTGGGSRTFTELSAEVRRENQRKEQIHSVALTAIRDFPFYQEKIEAAVETAIQSNMSADQFELSILRTTRTQAGQITSRMGAPNQNPLTVEAAICMSAGLPNIEKHYSPEVLQSVDDAHMRGYGVQQLLVECAHRNGYTCRAGERVHDGNLREILEYAMPPVHVRLNVMSTVSLPNILGNVANKHILEGYKAEDQTWREFATIKSTNNFYEQKHARMTDDFEFEEVGSGGEITMGSIGEESYTSQAKEHAKGAGLTRSQIINDDLGAFEDIRTRLGLGGSRALSRNFWKTFMNNASFYTTARGNYIEGSPSSVLDVSGVGLQSALIAYRTMKTPVSDGEKEVGDSNPPTLLLVPPQLEFIAKRLYQSTHVNTGGAAVAETVGDANVHAGMYRPVVQNRLADTSLTGWSTTAFYLFGPYLKPMVVTFLRGQQMPTIQNAVPAPNYMGIIFIGFYDFGCDQAEYLAGVKSKGAAG